MSQFVQTLMDGVAVGSLYALIALGYTMVYGILKFINFAHSDIFALGAWVAFTIATQMLRLDPIAETTPPIFYGVLILLLTMAVCGAIGFTIERLAYRPLRSAPRLNVLITAIGVSLFLQNIGQLKTYAAGIPFGPYPKLMPMLMDTSQPLFTIAETRVYLLDLVGFGVAILLMLGLEWLVYRTKLGRGMRAVSFNPANAALMGVPVDRVISITFVIGSALAAAAGLLYVIKYPANLKQTADTVWVMLGLKAFVAAVVGGIGNVRGAMLGGLAIGLIEFFGVAYLKTEYRDVYVFSLLILVLLVRPSGILGKTVVEKV
ncbi:MAG: branched-chain amino acid ABC transporter permease [Phycisphaerales bacterium]|nr:branched-chain amino acid ABC transporter permease [Phycisphaerales bacterium]